MTMISIDSVHEILLVNGELPEVFIGYLITPDGDSSHAGQSTLTNISIVLISRSCMYRQNPCAGLANRFGILPCITCSS